MLFLEAPHVGNKIIYVWKKGSAEEFSFSFKYSHNLWYYKQSNYKQINFQYSTPVLFFAICPCALFYFISKRDEFYRLNFVLFFFFNIRKKNNFNLWYFVWRRKWLSILCFSLSTNHCYTHWCYWRGNYLNWLV